MGVSGALIFSDYIDQGQAGTPQRQQSRGIEHRLRSNQPVQVQLGEQRVDHSGRRFEAPLIDHKNLWRWVVVLRKALGVYRRAQAPVQHDQRLVVGVKVGAYRALSAIQQHATSLIARGAHSHCD